MNANIENREYVNQPQTNNYHNTGINNEFRQIVPPLNSSINSNKNLQPAYVNQTVQDESDSDGSENSVKLLKMKQLENPYLLEMKRKREEQQKRIQQQLEQNNERLNNSYTRKNNNNNTSNNFQGSFNTDTDV